VNISLNFFFLYLCPRILQHHPDSWIQVVYDPQMGVGYAFISNLVATFVTLLLFRPEILSLKPTFDLVLLRRMLTYAFPLLIVGIAGMTNEVSDKIIFKFLLHVPEGVKDPDAYIMSQLGIYGANYKLAVLMTLFIQMFRYAAEPFFFAQAKEANAKQVYADVLKYFIIFGLFIFLLVTLFIGTVKYFIGPDFWEGLFIVPIVLLANLMLGIAYNQSVWYKLNDLTRFGAYIGLAGAAVTIIMNLLLVPEYSYLGAAWGHFACYFVMVILSYLWGLKYYHIKYQMGRIGIYFAIATGFFLVSYFLPVKNIFLSGIINFSMLAGFVVIAYFLEKDNFRKKAIKTVE